MSGFSRIVVAVTTVFFATITLSMANAGEVNLSIVKTSDDVHFDIASDLSGAMTPNVLSVLDWTDMEVWRVELEANHRFGKSFHVFGGLGFGLISDGDVRDSDYLGDNKTDEFSRSTATVDGKQQITGNIGLGWEFTHSFSVPLWRVGETTKRVAIASHIQVMPTIGYGYHKQEIDFTDGVQLIPDVGGFAGLNSSYNTEWRGVFIGLKSRVRLYENLYFNAGVRYFPDANFQAVGKWNLRPDLAQPSFKQSADANGLDLRLGLEWVLDSANSINVTYYDARFSTDSGSDETLTIFGIGFFTRLNEARWESKGWAVSYIWRFGS